MLLALLRFVRGTVEFQVTGKYVERFLNLAARARIPIWDGQREADSFRGCTLLSRQKELMELAQRVQVSWEQIEVFGSERLRRRYGRRLGLLCSGGVLALLLLLSQGLVWEVRVLGNETVPSQQVLTLAQSLGLRPGVWKRSLDVNLLADQITRQLEPVSWVGINLLGTVAEIEMVERVLPPELLDEEEPCNVVAGRAGLLTKLQIYEGKTEAKVGETVQQGSLLAAGIWSDKLGRTHYDHARAEAVVEFSEERLISIPLAYENPVPCGPHQNSRRLLLGTVSLPLSFGRVPNAAGFSSQPGLVEQGLYTQGVQQWYYSVRNVPLKLFGIPLPLTLQTQQYIPCQLQELFRSEEEAKALALSSLEQEISALERQEIDVLSRELQGKVEDGTFVLRAKLHCSQEVAQQQPIVLEEQAP